MTTIAAASPGGRRRLGASGVGFAAMAGAAALVLACGAARLSGFAGAPAAAPVIASAMVNFADGPDGAVMVRDFKTGRLLETVAARQGGFLRSTMRVMATERAENHIGPQPPFMLAALTGNRLELTDTATGQMLELEAFGPSNEAEFAVILQLAEAGK
jgi:putative photosynthetic complex assembly protein